MNEKLREEEPQMYNKESNLLVIKELLYKSLKN